MKTASWEMYLPHFINSVVIAKFEHDEVGLGFDAMLSHEVVRFLTTDHGISQPLPQRLVSAQNHRFALDEHELAMV